MTAVREHMRTDCVEARPADSLVTVSKALHSGRVGAALVVDDGNLVGIISERDIVRAIALGADLETSAVADFMSRLLTTVGPSEDMADAAELMSRQRIRHLPVLEDGRLVGVLSLRDVVGWSLRQLGYDETHRLARLVDLSL